ncbi:MAG TPA: adenosyl-hopene transferase HpnH [Candidatus Acidoferrales bacterium]|jgi:hopanoid biosynthesis associated radical SAM protein HpnH|nr:adenosyl-hopene transferase HpnH [Candidatus Acidoferrales bacterium]
MRVPLSLTTSMAGYLTGKKMSGAQKFPLVMMLEPLHACNLTCTGCGRIREYKSTINEMLTVEECLKAVDDCGAPIVSLCGGEPMIYPELDRLVKEILDRKKHIYLCTNGMFIRKRLKEFKPTSRLFFNVHLDGLEKTHDICVERDGVFREAIEGIKAAKAAGFLVTSNTTVYKETDIEEIADLFAYLQTLGVDGHMISPAYSYAAVMTKEIFMSRDEIRDKFRQASKLLERYNIVTSPIYMEYLRGERELMCTAWGMPTYNTRGWKGPCYLMTDAHHSNFKEFIDNTPWEKYGHGRDPRCEDCMVHAGYEASAVLGGNKKLGDTWKMLTWTMSGKMGGLIGEPSERELQANGNGHSAGSGHSNGNGSAKRAIPVAPSNQSQDEVFRIL